MILKKLKMKKIYYLINLKKKKILFKVLMKKYKNKNNMNRKHKK
jgi:hypothetical protein